MFDFQVIPTAEASVLTLMKSIDKVIINPIIIFMFACAMVYFLYGLAQYLLSPGNEEVHKKSKSVMLWGVIGLFIMVAVFGIMKIILNTVGENKIKVNSNGDYVVENITVNPSGDFVATTNTPLLDKNISDSKNTGSDLFGKSTDVSFDKNAPTLSAVTFTTNPFATYEKNALCWQQQQYGKASTEFQALNKIKSDLRAQYLFDTGKPATTDITKIPYPDFVATKVLYDKAGKIYYAWVDARGPKVGGTMANCALKIISPAPVIPDSAITSQSDISSSLDAPDLPHVDFITSPFAVYDFNRNLCWTSRPVVHTEASTEYAALESVNALARSEYLKQNPTVSKTDVSKAYYPIIFETQVLFENKTKTYYAWVDARAPIGTGKMSDCIPTGSTKILIPARELPASNLFSKVTATKDQVNLSTTVAKNAIKNFTVSPFTQKFLPNALCWRTKDIYGKAPTEFAALEDVKAKTRAEFLRANNLVDKDTPTNLPILYGALTAYDKVTKNYFVWWDVRAPIKTGRLSDCNLVALGPATNPNDGLLPQSTKPNPFTLTYTSDNQYYRVVDSAVDPNYTIARNGARDNALSQIVALKGLTDILDIGTYTMLEEKYYNRDAVTGNYDYWVAIQVIK